MKKILLVMVLLVLFPLNVFATTFELDDIDMDITFDENVWYVFTPDNILNNPELDELGISYEVLQRISGKWQSRYIKYNRSTGRN